MTTPSTVTTGSPITQQSRVFVAMLYDATPSSSSAVYISDGRLTVGYRGGQTSSMLNDDDDREGTPQLPFIENNTSLPGESTVIADLDLRRMVLAHVLARSDGLVSNPWDIFGIDNVVSREGDRPTVIATANPQLFLSIQNLLAGAYLSYYQDETARTRSRR
jgi:hypothetical protein